MKHLLGTFSATHPYLPLHPNLTWVDAAEGLSTYVAVFLDFSEKAKKDNEAGLQTEQQRCQAGAQTWCVPRSHWRCSLYSPPLTD